MKYTYKDSSDYKAAKVGFAIGTLCVIAFWIAAVCVAWHFIAKVW